jgi:hypothetical protein
MVIAALHARRARNPECLVCSSARCPSAHRRGWSGCVGVGQFRREVRQFEDQSAGRPAVIDGAVRPVA